MRLALLTLSLLAFTLAHAAPVVWQVQDPVQPGETAMLFGDGFGDKPQVSVGRVSDGPAGTPGPVSTALPLKPAPVLQARDQCVKFVLPASDKPGLYAYSLQSPGGKATGLLNRPTVWWAQLDPGTPAEKGATLRLFGKSLGGPQRTILVQGKRSVRLTAAGQSDPWAMQCPLPADLPPGDYTVRAHCGLGGAAGWSEPATLTIAPPPAWPTKTFNIRDFGADGSGTRDDTAALQAALDAAGASGGGIVLLPRGRYQATDTLAIPRGVELRGERQEWTALFWPDMATPPEALIKGTNSFALAELTLYASNHRHIVVGDLGNVPEAGNVRLWRVRIRADMFRGHMKPEEVDARFRAALRHSTGGPDCVRLGGDNIHIADCDFYGSGRSLYLSRARNSVVRDTSLYNGRWGWYCLEGSQNLIFDRNRLIGGDLQSTGGGLANYGTAASTNIYFAHTVLRNMMGWDREAITSDAGGGLYYGPIVKAEGRTVTLPDDPKPGKRDWTGAAVYIVQGKGWSQTRTLTGVEGATLTVDAPWDVPPDATSLIEITQMHRHYLVVGNDFADNGVSVQFYGGAIEHIVAGNTCARSGGYQTIAKPYGGYHLPPDKNPNHQLSFFCQFLDNTITEGALYRAGANNAILSGEANIGVFGWPLTKDWPWPYNVGAVVRGNRLLNNARIHVGGSANANPSVADVVIEGNDVRSADVGVQLDRGVTGLVVRRNRLENLQTGVWLDSLSQGVLIQDNTLAKVQTPELDEQAVRRAAEEKIRAFMGRPEPVAVYDFEEIKHGAIADLSGNGFGAVPRDGVTLVPGVGGGQAVRFDGTGLLTVSHEPAVFNAPDMTVSFWVKPETLKGRRGLVCKRAANAAAPFVITQEGAAIGFQACDEGGKWSFNFGSAACLKANEWTHVAVVMTQGTGIAIYADGKVVGQKQNAEKRCTNLEPLVMGREAWGGDPPDPKQPGFFVGCLDRVRLWTRALPAAEMEAERAKGVTP